MFWKLIIIALGLVVAYYRWQRRKLYEIYQQLPECGLKNNHFLGVALNFSGTDEDRMEVLKTAGRIAVERGGLTTGWMVNKLYVGIADPIIAEMVLKTCLDKDETTMKYGRTVAGNGSIFAPVPIWRRRRKMTKPIFAIRNLNGFTTVLARQSLTMTKLLRKEVGKGDFSIWKYYTTFTFDGICENSLGIQLNSQLNQHHPFLNAMDLVLYLLSQRICSPWLYLDFVYKMLPRYKTFIEARTVMHDFVDDLIRKKQKELEARDDGDSSDRSKYKDLFYLALLPIADLGTSEHRTILEMLIEASARDPMGYTGVEVREEILTIITAGTDTTAVGASFATLMLARYPHVQEKVYQELQEVFGGSDRPVTVKDLPHLKYLEAVVKETLRMYPAVPAIMREATSDVKLPNGGTLVDGTGILVHIWALHRNPKYWGSDAEDFRPERFLEGPLQHHAQFLPFSYAMRNCVGSSYAMMSMKTVLATMLRQFRVLPPSDLNPGDWTKLLKVKFDITMKHVDNYIVRVEPRNPLAVFT